MAQTILLVEDSPEMAALVGDLLEADGYTVLHTTTREEGWRRFEERRPDLVILDVGLPDGSGLDLCRRIRAHPAAASTPVIVLTCKERLEEKAEGFEAGADHYLVKTDEIDEIKLWVGSLLRRVRFDEKEGGVLRAEDLVIDPARHTVTAGETLITNLTRKEFDLLYELVRSRPKVLSHAYILSTLWRSVLRDNTVRVHIKHLRSKLGPAARHIVTVPGVGYRFD